MRKTIMYTPKRISQTLGLYTATVMRCTSPMRYVAFFNGTCEGSFPTQGAAIKEIKRIADNRETIIKFR